MLSKHKKGNTTLIMVIITVLIFGLLVLFAYQGLGIGQGLFKKNLQNIENREDSAKLDSLSEQSNSDEINDIENDLNATDIDSLDSEVNSIENDLNSL